MRSTRRANKRLELFLFLPFRGTSLQTIIIPRQVRGIEKKKKKNLSKTESRISARNRIVFVFQPRWAQATARVFTKESFGVTVMRYRA